MKYDRPGQFPTWRALLNEIICNIVGCSWERQRMMRLSGARAPQPVIVKACKRCRRTINV